MFPRSTVHVSLLGLIVAVLLAGCKGCGKKNEAPASNTAALVQDAGTPPAPVPFTGTPGDTNILSVGYPAIERDYFGNSIVQVELKNVGQDAVTDIELSVTSLAEDGSVLARAVHQPVTQKSVHRSAKQPLPPGGIRRVMLPLEKVPPRGSEGLRIVVERVGIEKILGPVTVDAGSPAP